ncbi:hypothetical protein KAW08_06030 [bacterium]|nr:hypothetical protein [bacterium]
MNSDLIVIGHLLKEMIIFADGKETGGVKKKRFPDSSQVYEKAKYEHITK